MEGYINNGSNELNNGTNQYGMQSQDYYNQQVYQGQYNYQQPNNGMNPYDYNNQQMPNNIHSTSYKTNQFGPQNNFQQNINVELDAVDDEDKVKANIYYKEVLNRKTIYQFKLIRRSDNNELKDIKSEEDLKQALGIQ